MSQESMINQTLQIAKKIGLNKISSDGTKSATLEFKVQWWQALC